MNGGDRHRAAERPELHRRRAERPRRSRRRRARAPRIGRRRAERVHDRPRRRRAARSSNARPASRRPDRRRRGGSPGARMCARSLSTRSAARVSFTSRMSIAAVARSGMIVRAPAPTCDARPGRGRSASATAARPAASETPAPAPRRRTSCSMRSESSGTASSIARSRRSRRDHAVVEAVNGHAAVVVLHRREQRRQAQRRVRDPVAVVAAVHAGPWVRTPSGRTSRCRARRTRPSGRPLECPGPSRMIIRSARSLSRYRVDRRHEARRAGFFLAVEDDVDVRRRREPGRLQRVDGGEQRDDRRLVVRRRPRVEAPVVLELRRRRPLGTSRPPRSMRPVRSTGRTDPPASTAGSTGCPS